MAPGSFGGELIDGELWGRGALDMKGIAVMHAAAALALAGGERDPVREVVVAAVADEEVGGAEGAGWLVGHHPDRVGFRDGRPAPEVLGEGGFGLSGILSHPVMREQFAILAEAADGPLTRVFRLLAGPTGGLAVRALAPQLRRRAGAIGHLLSDTVTPTELHGGYKDNVVPGRAEASFDARLLPDSDPDEVLSRLRRTGQQHGVAVDEIWRTGGPTSGRSPLFDLLAQVSRQLPEAPVPSPSLTPGVTDLRFFRARGARGGQPPMDGPRWCSARSCSRPSTVPTSASRSRGSTLRVTRCATWW